MPRLIKWSFLVFLVFAATSWWVKWPAKDIHRASGGEMNALEPDFGLSLNHLPDSQINKSFVAEALADAKSMGEECAFYCAVACPKTGRVMYVLSVRQRTDTELVYASSVNGERLVAKAYWSGLGGWRDNP